MEKAPSGGSEIDVRANLRAIQDEIAAAARAVDRDPADVTLIGVAKKQPLERLEAALAAGHRVFGENRVQEAQGKYPDLRARYPDLELHLVGPLQSNKAADAVALFDVIQTVDREKIARAIAKEMAEQGRRPRLFVQVNVGEEPQKAGIDPAETETFVRWCRDDLGLTIDGLMCIPPLDEDPALYFALLAEMRERLGLPSLSMGMSADYPTAIRLGATHVRVGSALFGPREV
jgi:pyridoxal phosphate enzyme (YggS family)